MDITFSQSKTILTRRWTPAGSQLVFRVLLRATSPPHNKVALTIRMGGLHLQPPLKKTPYLADIPDLPDPSSLFIHNNFIWDTMYYCNFGWVACSFLAIYCYLIGVFLVKPCA